MKDLLEKMAALYGEIDEMFQDGAVIELGERERLIQMCENLGEIGREFNYHREDGSVHMHLMELVKHPELMAEQIVRISRNPYLKHLMQGKEIKF